MGILQMSIRHGLFQVWIVLTDAYEVLGFIDGAPRIILKFQLAAQGRWLLLAMATAMAVAVPLFVLGLGRALFWMSDIATNKGLNQKSSLPLT
jgi:hypothetical protein